MRRLILVLTFAASAAPVFAQAPPVAIYPPLIAGVTPPIFGGVSSGVTGGGTVISPQLLAPDGTAVAPSYSFASQTTTGFYLPGASQIRWSIAGTDRIRIDGSAFALHVTSALTWGSSGVTSDDVALSREAAGHLFQRNSTNAQRASWANTYTSATNYEAFSVDWQTLANTAMVGSRTAATGLARGTRFLAQDSSGSDTYSSIEVKANTLPFIRLEPRATAAYGANSTVGVGNFIQVGGAATSGATSGTVNFLSVQPIYNQSSGTAANTDLLVNRTQTAVGSGPQLLADFQVGGTPQLSLTNAGKVSVYNAVATAGQGVEVIRAQATTGTVTNSGTASIATWTPGAADVEVEVSCRVNITTSTNHSFSCDVTYTDVANVARTRVLPMYPISGNQLTNSLMTNAIGTGDYASMVIRIGVKASTAITVRTSAGGTFTSVVYTASGTIKQVS